jgi:NAD(P)H-dependent FMN reductase
MEDKIRIAIILGSSREGRLSETVAGWVRSQFEADPRFELDMVDPLDLGLFGYGRHDEAGVAAVGEKLDAADGFIVVTPEYNHSYTGELKSLVDAYGEEWQDKPVGFVSYGGISGGLRAVEHLRQVFAELRAVGLRDTVSFAGAWSRFEAGGRLRDPQNAEEAMARLRGQLYRWSDFLRELRRRQRAEAVA